MTDPREEAERIFNEIAPLGYEGEPLPVVELIASAFSQRDQRIKEAEEIIKEGYELVCNLESGIIRQDHLLRRCREVLTTLWKSCQDEGWGPRAGEKSEVDKLLAALDEAEIRGH